MTATFPSGVEWKDSGRRRNFQKSLRRIEPPKSADDFPTPPKATRALLNWLQSDRNGLKRLGTTIEKGDKVLEPACNRGFMAEVLGEYFTHITSSDYYDYGYYHHDGICRDFTQSDKDLSGEQVYADKSFDWVITNPPFNQANDFAIQGMRVARKGVCLLLPLSYLGSRKRYDSVFSQYSMSCVLVIPDKVGMFKGCVNSLDTDPKNYSWFIWMTDRQQAASQSPFVEWIQVRQKDLVLPGDDTLPKNRFS